MNPLWQPSEELINASNISKFIKQINRCDKQKIDDFQQLYDYSVTKPEEFWSQLWDFAQIVSDHKGETVLENGQRMPGARWFPQARLNFAQNLLRKNDSSPAIIFRGEDKVRLSYRWDELNALVSRCAQALKATGVVEGDRIAAFMPNMPHTIIFMLATASIGAIWSSCSPDFGVQGVVDRFGQIKPKILLAADGYFYNGKTYPCHEKLEAIAKQLIDIKKIVIVDYINNSKASELDQTVSFDSFIAPFKALPIEFSQLPFSQPLYIMFSSGTTGAPKCIVHSAGGTLLQHLKEHLLHTDVKAGDRVFYFTTCGWMMWNWLVSGLACEATLLLYDGSPFYPDGNVLFEYAEQEKMTVFGTSAKYIEALIKNHIKPATDFDLTSLKTMLSTGSPLSEQGFNFVYDEIKADICLSSISGGTDIVSCFALGSPVLAVWPGELQCLGLGMAVKVLDDEGNEMPVGKKGELSCIAPFPSMPIGFWDDPKGDKYHNAYFAKLDNIWSHGDYVEMTEHGGMIIHGRSDAVLNPGGVRIGTAEIYRQVEKIDAVLDSVVIGQRWNNDVRVVLFVMLRDGVELNQALETRIRQTIRSNTTPRHVPEIIIQVADIPRTKSGKTVELAVRNIVHKEPIKNIQALANPQALDYFKDLRLCHRTKPTTLCLE